MTLYYIQTNIKTNRTDIALESIIDNVQQMSSLIDELKREQDNLINKTDETYNMIYKTFYSDDESTLKPSETIKSNEDGKNNESSTFEQNNSIKHTSIFKRGDIFIADLSPAVGSEQDGTRPVLIISSDVINRFSPTVTIAPLTSLIQKAKLPTHIEINHENYGLEQDSVVLVEHIQTIDKSRFLGKITSLDLKIMNKVDKAIQIQNGLVKL